MQLSKRSKLSLAQLISELNSNAAFMLLDKHNFDPYVTNSGLELSHELKSAPEDKLSNLIKEIVRTSGSLRNGVSPRYRYDDYFEELRKSLLLDGYVIDAHCIKSLDPTFEGKEPIEDELLNQLNNSSLDGHEEIKSCIIASADDFIKKPPDFNGSLTNIRIGIETIVRKIAIEKGFVSNRKGNTWGPSLGFLKQIDFLSEKEEKTLASVFTFISDGAHIPIGFTEEEFVRLGRHLCASMCYFIMKKYNA